MQLFILIMMLAILAHQPRGLGVSPVLDGWEMLAAVLGPYALVSGAMLLACRRAWRVLALRPGASAATLRRLDGVMTISRAALLGLFLTQVFVLGWLSWLRANVADWVLVPEVLAMAPVLASVLAGWWAYYPVDRRVRESMLIRDMESGEAVWPIWPRGRYVWSQARHQVLLLLVPLLALLTWMQAVGRWAPATPLAGYEGALVFAGGLGVFLFAPLMIRGIWDTAPLPAGSLRDRLLGMCRSYGVKVRGLLLWRTYGGMINGAVMGLVGPVRYVLLTDGLVERMEDDHVEAVMAHELGHVKRRHMPWLAVCAIGTFSGAMLVLAAMETLLAGVIGERWAAVRHAGDAAAIALAAGGWAAVFGYISRRFERQADTFAVQHMARRMAAEAKRQAVPREADRTGPGPDRDEGDADDGDRISRQAAETVARALLRVAELNHHPADRRSWRHGSIRWRVDYLLRLAGTPTDRCSIDGEVARLRWACAGLLGMVIAFDLMMAM